MTSEENKVDIYLENSRLTILKLIIQELILKTIDFGRTVLHYGWIPFIIYVGYTRSSPQPSLIKLISPLA